MADRPPKPPPKPSFGQTQEDLGGSRGKDTPPTPRSDDRRKLGRRGESLKRQLADFFGGVALFLSAVGDDHCAEVVLARRDLLAEAYARMAEKNPAVLAFFERLTVGSAYTEVVAVTLTTALPIAAHHSAQLRALLANSPFIGVLASDETLMAQAMADQGHPVTQVHPNGEAERVASPGTPGRPTG